MARANKTEDVSEELETLRRVEDLLKILARHALAGHLDEIMSDKNHRLLFEQAGKLTAKQLGDKIKTSPMTVSRLWQKWEQLGLLAKDGQKYRRVL